jgi:hypothetical protein
MGTALFFLSSLAVGIYGADTLTRRFETLPSERIGASGFLFLLCLGTSAVSTFCYAESSRSLGRRTRWFTGLLGGVVAAATFCAPVGAGYAGLLNALGLWFLVAPTIALPTLVGWYWPILSARLGARHNASGQSARRRSG